MGPTSLQVWIRPAGIATALNYGMDRVRLLAPVPSETERATVSNCLPWIPRATVDFLTTTENTVEIEGQEKP